MTIPTDVLVAMIGGGFIVLAAVIGAAGTIIAKIIGRKVDRVYDQVTPNGGESAHDKLMAEIKGVEQRRKAALTEHVRRLHPGAQQ